MKKIIFIRTSPYNYKLPNKSLYKSLDEIGLQKSQPHILKPNKKTEKVVISILKRYKPSQVFCSEFIRSQETAKLFSKKISIVSDLNEIKFSMDNFSSKEEFPTDEFDYRKINETRFRFSQALIHDQLQENQKSIRKRIINLEKYIINCPDRQNILCISHGFIMKLFENFFLTGKKDINFLVSLYNWKNPTFDFLGGFIVSYKNNSVKVKKLKID